MRNLFETPIREKKVREGIMAYQYRNGNINIDGKIYSMYSMTEAIKKYRQDNPLKK